LALQVEAYFDESGSHAGAPVLCVAGYIFEKPKAIALTDEWNGVLRARNLPYFHMVECAHGNGPFAKLAKSDRIQLVARMIQLIKQYSVQGIAVTVNSKEFEQLMPKHPIIGTPYTFCAQIILAGIRGWIEYGIRAGFPIDDMAYIFESGHRSQAEANRLMNTLFTNRRARAALKYAGHVFIRKETAPPVQAADLLAWQWYTDKRHQLEGRPRRKDCAKLLEHHHNAVHLSPDRMIAILNDPAFDLTRINNAAP
jgi:hypothetical protein